MLTVTKKMQNAGDILKFKRRSLGKTLFEVSQETKMQEKYIKAIENNDFQSFDSPVFVKGFIKIYADYLDVDVDKVLALYRRQSSEEKEDKKTKRKTFKLQSVFSPATIAIGIVAIVVLLVLVYLYSQFNKYNATPTLEITNPQNNSTQDASEITINGRTASNASITINGVNIENVNGNFEYKVILSKGENEITIISANSKNQQIQTSKKLFVTYAPKEATQDVAGATDKEFFQVWLKISQEPAWIGLNIDGKQILAQVVTPKTTSKYKAVKSIEIITGKPNLTKLYIDGKQYQLKINKEKGTASLACIIELGLLNCPDSEL